ncbi:hypothetical protein L6R52_26115, partial [Myxococcota bacterium]|nr:hypothetical protein [Myxococcota bacterium]
MGSTEGTAPSARPTKHTAGRTWRLGPELAVETDGSPALEAALDEVFGAMADTSAPAPAPVEVIELGLAPSARGGRLLLVDGLQTVRVALRASLAPTL